MTDEKTHLSGKGVNEPVILNTTPMEVQTPPITENSLVITAVLVIGAYVVFGLPGMIAGVFLVVAYLKMKKGEYDKAIRYNRIARVLAIIFLTIGILLTILCVGLLFVYYAIIVPIYLTKK